MTGLRDIGGVGGIVALLIVVSAVIRRRQARAAQEDAIAPPRPAPSQAPSEPVTATPEPDPADAGPGAREVQRRLYALAFDGTTLDVPGRVPVGGHAAHAPIVAASTDTLRTIESQPRYAPRRPDLLAQLLKALQDEEASLRDVARIIGQDPALTGNLLRVAHSPLYRVNDRPVESIERAMTLVGSNGMRAIVAAALFQPVLAASGPFARVPEIVWEHTLYAASAAEAHAAHIGKVDPFAAQLLALVLGLGTIVTLRVVLDQYAARPEVEPDAGVTVAILDSWSVPTASRIAASWGLSERVQDALQGQLLEGDAEVLSTLGRSLRFGRMAAALSMLVAAGRFDEDEALAALGARGVAGAPVRRIWDRLRRPQA